MEGNARRLASVAREQHGVVSRAQGLALGMSPSGLDRAVHAGRLERVHQGVLRVAGAPWTWEQRLLAAVVAAGDEAVASHRSAAILWDLGALGDHPVELSVNRRRLPRIDGAVVHRSGDLAPRWATTRGGIPTTDPVRTLVDLGAVAPAWFVREALERALVRRLVTVAAVEGARTGLGRRGRAGAGVLGRILDDRALGSRPADSVIEARLAPVLAAAADLSPVFQHEVWHGGRMVGRLDFAYPHVRLGIEVDGLDVHGTATALQRDLTRQNALVAVGWTLLRFTWHDVIRRPSHVTAVVRRGLTRLDPASFSAR